MLVCGPHFENRGLHLEMELLGYKSHPFWKKAKLQPNRWVWVGWVLTAPYAAGYSLARHTVILGTFLSFYVLQFQISSGVDFEDGVNLKEGDDPRL